MAHFQQLVLVLAFLAAASAEPQGNNEYLPPKDGYTYNKPSVPFPSSPSTQYSPPPAPQQTYRPPAPRPVAPAPSRPPVFNNPRPSPTYGTPAPAYRPPTPTYRPPAPQPTYRPPSPPAYKPPQPTYNQPPAPTYGPPPTQNTFRPSPTPAQPIGDHSHDHGHSADHVHEAGMPYDFTYAVRAEQPGDAEFSQNEVSDGDQVKGEYRVQLPDGRLQIVRYTADWKTGFHADVSYEGEAKFPDYVPNASRPNPVIADRPSGGYSYPSPGQQSPPDSYGPPSTGGPY